MLKLTMESGIFLAMHLPYSVNELRLQLLFFESFIFAFIWPTIIQTIYSSKNLFMRIFNNWSNMSTFLLPL